MGREEGARIKQLLPVVDCDIPMPEVKPPLDVANQPWYADGSDIESIDYIVAQGWYPHHACGCINKYTTRYEKKDGLRDLLKARQYLDWLINLVETGDIYRGERSTK